MSLARHDSITEQAIGWMVKMQSGRMDAAQRAQLEAWLQSSGQHQQVWDQLQGVVNQQFDTLRKLDQHLPAAVDGVKALLVEQNHTRRDVLRGFAGLGVMGTGLFSLSHTPMGQSWLADLSTGTGERGNFLLDDGSRLSLNAATAVDFDQSSTQRLLRLRRGELIVQVAPNATRPFIVRSEHGDARALGTRFLVRTETKGTHVTVLEHSVQLTSKTGQALVLQEGQSAMLRESAIEPGSRDERYRADWLQGQLRVFDEPLGAVIAALRPYCPGLLRLSNDAADLRVMGVFSLDSPQQTITTLSETLPIEVRRFGPWLTVIARKT
jgi:transmembrane sensor